MHVYRVTMRMNIAVGVINRDFGDIFQALKMNGGVDGRLFVQLRVGSENYCEVCGFKVDRREEGNRQRLVRPVPNRVAIRIERLD